LIHEIKCFRQLEEQQLMVAIVNVFIFPKHACEIGLEVGAVVGEMVCTHHNLEASVFRTTAPTSNLM
jgi:hypothetical protein